MMTYSPVTSESTSTRAAFDALWTSNKPVNWTMPAHPELPPQEMLLELLWRRDLDTVEEYAGVPV